MLGGCTLVGTSKLATRHPSDLCYHAAPPLSQDDDAAPGDLAKFNWVRYDDAELKERKLLSEIKVSGHTEVNI